MPETKPQILSTWFSKFFECIYLLIIAAEILYILMTTVLLGPFYRYGQDKYTDLFIAFLGGSLFLALAYSIWWHQKEKDTGFNSGGRHAWLQGAMRYFLAYEVSVYGFAKLLKTQFAFSYARADTAVGNLSGFELTWNYFGYSHTFAVILGLIQIGGGTMLLFKRTRLLALFTLMPVMVNIVLINIFYSIALGAFINSLIITFGLLYLMMLRWKEIMALFFPAQEKSATAKVNYLKPVLKLLLIALAFFNIYYYLVIFPPSVFTGKWTVQEITVNGKVVADTNWQANPNLWRNIYIEEYGYLEISSNPYLFDAKKSSRGTYRYDAEKHRLKIVLGSYLGAMDSTNITVSHYDGERMQWNTVFHNDTLQYKLLKTNNARP